MKKILLVILLVASTSFAMDIKGSVQLDFTDVELTDAVPTYTNIVNTQYINDVFVHTITDKGSTVSITPVLSDTDDTLLGPTPTATVIANGGGTDTTPFSRIMAPRAKITVTKTEAGTTSGFVVSVRGNQ